MSGNGNTYTYRGSGICYGPVNGHTRRKHHGGKHISLAEAISTKHIWLVIHIPPHRLAVSCRRHDTYTQVQNDEKWSRSTYLYYSSLLLRYHVNGNRVDCLCAGTVVATHGSLALSRWKRTKCESFMHAHTARFLRAWKGLVRRYYTHSHVCVFISAKHFIGQNSRKSTKNTCHSRTREKVYP